MTAIHELFRLLRAQDGSDLHLAAGLRPRLRVRGSLSDVAGSEILDDAGVLGLIRPLVDEGQWQEYSEHGDLDFAYSLEGEARFRANFLRQEHGAGAVFRLIPEIVLTAEQIGLPAAIADLANFHRGLVLITGPTGSGKSTTLAAIIDRINDTFDKHIITIEDPVEFVHQNRRCVFSQREVGRDAHSFADALRSAVRQDADVILVGEMRDLETISLAVTAAEMGSLVFGTLHTNSAAKTIDRLIDVFPADEQPQIRTTLAESVSGIVAQQLLPKADGDGRCAAHEILLRTSGLPNVIREGNTPMLKSIIQGGKSVGMQSMDESLEVLANAGLVTRKEALRRAADPKRLASILDR